MSPQRLNLPDNLKHALHQAVSDIVELGSADAVVLFGSYAEGSAQDGSDLDLLVVAPTNNRWRLASKLYVRWHELRQALPELPPADILVYTPRQFLEAMVVGFPAYQAVRTGVLLYGKLPEPSPQVAE